MPIRIAPSLCFVMLAGLLAGCQRADEIEHYRQVKPEALLKTVFGETSPPPAADRPPAADKVPAATHRMLAAIIPHAPQFWFFKLVGPIEAVDRQSEAFAALIRSVHFDGDSGKPAWSLPPGWRELPGSGTGPAARFATLQVGSGDKPLEVAVTSLSLEGLDALLMNINRWRGQMGLRPIETKEQLAESISPMKTADGDPAFVVELAGRFQAGGMGRPPLTAGDKTELPAGHPSIEPKTVLAETGSASPDAASAPFKFDAPAGWQAGQPDAMRAAVLTVKDGSRSAEISVTALPPFAGDVVVKNVNRWRGQLKLPAADEKEIAATVKPIRVGDVSGSYVEILGPKDATPREAILGVIAPQANKVWFIKLKGDAELAEREKPRFEAFVKSIQFNSPK